MSEIDVFCEIFNAQDFCKKCISLSFHVGFFIAIYVKCLE